MSRENLNVSDPTPAVQQLYSGTTPPERQDGGAMTAVEQIETGLDLLRRREGEVVL
jgi:hypothetical protein